MNAQEFVRKWALAKGRERGNSQEHFIDLCRLLGEPTPAEADPTGEVFTFEKGARTEDGNGWADVWYRKHFGWEYKGKNTHKDLRGAYAQLQKYREALENPPLLVVCDFDRFEVHTNWNTESWTYCFDNADIATDEPVLVRTLSGAIAKHAPEVTALEVLHALFEEPERLKPGQTAEEITNKAAGLIEPITKELRDGWKVEDMRIARFVSRMIFCMFASDIGLLPKETFSRLVADRAQDGDAPAFRTDLAELFRTMNTGGRFWGHTLPRFNGRLFEDDDVPEAINAHHVRQLADLDALEWGDVEPAIFGTLFERSIDKEQRKALGKHYTSRDDIELILEPVLMAPLRGLWRIAQADALKAAQPRSAKPMTIAEQREKVRPVLAAFHKRLYSIKVLDPACGSGNFLYVALSMLKTLEKEVIAYGWAYDIKIEPKVHPQQLYGIEVNPYAHTLASIVIWIGHLQWKRKNGEPLASREPILEPLNQVEFRDAVLDRSDWRKPREAKWPKADVIVGNPPYIGVRKMRHQLGDQYVEQLWAVYEDRVDRRSDYVCYWFEKARAAIEKGDAHRAGLLATQAIRGGANRLVLERIKQTGDIFYAQADRKWILDGAVVRVSMVGFDDGSEVLRRLNEHPDDDPKHALERAVPVEGINANLTSATDVTKAQRLKENVGISFMGDTKVGPFDIPALLANNLLAAPNPDGRKNSDVVRPWVNGLDITRRPRNMWIIDFPPGMSEKEAAKYEAPFEYIRRWVRPDRVKNARKVYAEKWWIHGEPRPDMRNSLAGLNRYLGTPNVTKYRFFVWLEPEVLPDHQLIVFARSDDYFFGVLQSRVHEVWALLMGTQLESRPRYTPTTCFETFPLPHGTKEDQWAISIAAKDLDDLRNGWLNPDGMVGAKELSRRTLTNLYNERPSWLQHAHRTLDEAVFAAYGWREAPDELPDEEIVARLLKLNLQREPA